MLKKSWSKQTMGDSQIGLEQPLEEAQKSNGGTGHESFIIWVVVVEFFWSYILRVIENKVLFKHLTTFLFNVLPSFPCPLSLLRSFLGSLESHLRLADSYSSWSPLPPRTPLPSTFPLFPPHLLSSLQTMEDLRFLCINLSPVLFVCASTFFGI